VTEERRRPSGNAGGRALYAALCLALLAGLSGCSTAAGPDPWEGANRGVFTFNEGVDRYAIEPVASGWNWLFPEIVQDGISNFFENLSQPMIMANDLLQGKPKAASQDLGRLLVNSTAGVLGFIDVATRIGIPENDEDFGQTLGVWGVPNGPFVMLPVLGPFTLRDAFAFPVDALSHPHVWFVSGAWAIGLGTTRLVNIRADFLEEVRENRQTALDYYVFIRNAYLANREKRVNDGADRPPEEYDDLYYAPEEDDAEPDGP